VDECKPLPAALQHDLPSAAAAVGVAAAALGCHHGPHERRGRRHRLGPGITCLIHHRVALSSRNEGLNRPISVYRLGEMPIQSGGQSVSAPRREAGAR